MALIFFVLFPASLYPSLPLTETVSTLPEGDVELLLSGQIIELDRTCRRENLGLGLGILPSFSLWYTFQYLHEGLQSGDHDLGDSFLRLWFYVGDFWGDRGHVGLSFTFRIPTGSSAYDNPKWRNLAFGNDEFKLGAVMKFDLNPVYLHTNLFYVMRESSGEDFYNGFYLNPMRKKTYQKGLGFNPASSETFLSKDRLKNDHAVFALGINTDYYYPFVPYLELYASHRVYRRMDENDHLPIEGAGVNPVLLGCGCRYFFTQNNYGEIYGIYNPVQDKDYVGSIIGLGAGFQF